jgi:hypothetical protein
MAEAAERAAGEVTAVVAAVVFLDRVTAEMEAAEGKLEPVTLEAMPVTEEILL